MMCSRSTIASPTWNGCQLIDIFFSACGVNMLPPWPSSLRHRHPCRLSPTYTRSVFEGGFEFLRPSVRGTPTTHSEVLLLRVGAIIYLVHLLKTVAWYSTWSSIVWGLHNHTNAARRPQCAVQTVLLCKRPPTASIIICTEDVTAARRTLQRLC